MPGSLSTWLPPLLTREILSPRMLAALQLSYQGPLPEGFALTHFIVLVPMLVCAVALFRRSLTQVFLGVYLPVLILFPTYFHIKLPALPPIDVSEAVLVPLGLAVAYRLWPRWKLTTTDIWMGLFVLSSCAFYFRVHDRTIGTFHLFFSIFEGFVPYMLGKLLIEQFDIRLQTVRRVVSLMALCCAISLLEYAAGRNPFAFFWSRFFPDQPLVWHTQFRWGFGRVAGPFGQSELAGMMFLVAIVFAIWAAYSFPWEKKFAHLPHPFRKSTILFWLLAITMFTTQARGPWLGCLLAVPITMLGRARRLLRNGLLLILVCVITALGVYAKGKTYTSTRPATDEQQTAQYRAQLIDSYVPTAKQGGAWGWGEHFPIAPGAESIDNEYLFLWLVQGWVGTVAFCLIGLDSILRLIAAIARSTGKRDRFFALTLLGAICGILLTVGTVFLGAQPFQVFFLLAGWAQSVKTVTVQREERKLAFAHVLT